MSTTPPAPGAPSTTTSSSVTPVTLSAQIALSPSLSAHIAPSPCSCKEWDCTICSPSGDLEFEIKKASNTVEVDLTAQKLRDTATAAALVNARKVAASAASASSAAAASSASADATAAAASSSSASADASAAAASAAAASSAAASSAAASSAAAAASASSAAASASSAAASVAGSMCEDKCRVNEPNCGLENCRGAGMSQQAKAAAADKAAQVAMDARNAVTLAPTVPSSKLVQVQKEMFEWDRKKKVNVPTGYRTVACFIITGTDVKEISVSRLKSGGIRTEDTTSNLFLTIMNKLSAENADSLFVDILALPVDTPADCETIAKVAFNKALDDKKFQDLSARIIVEIGRQTQMAPYPWKACEPISGKGANFFQFILENCQRTFDSRGIEIEDKDEKKLHEKKILSLCTFIGHLYNVSRVEAFIIPYLNALLIDSDSELDIKSFHAMLTICGKQLHSSFYGKILIPKYRGYMDQLYAKYKSTVVGLGCKNMAELIDGGWVLRGAASTLEFQSRTLSRNDAAAEITAEQERARQKLLEGATPLTDAEYRASQRALRVYQLNRSSGSPGSTSSSGFLTRNSPLAGGGGRSPTFTSSPLAGGRSPAFGAGNIPSLQLGPDDGGVLEQPFFPEHECSEDCSNCRHSPQQPLFMRSPRIGGGGSAAAEPSWCSSLGGGGGGGGGCWSEQRDIEAAVKASLQSPAPLPSKAAAAECEGCDNEGCHYCFAPDNGFDDGEQYNPLGF